MFSNTFRNIVVRFAIMSTLFVAWAGAGVVETNTVAQQKNAASALGGTFIIGDSTTWRLTGEYDGMANLWAIRHPDWTVDGVGGRVVTQLASRIAWHLANVDSSPANFIMALGTNPDPSGAWNKHAFELSIEQLPPTTKIVMVIPARAARNGELQREKSDQVTQYAAWLREIAAERGNVVTSEWRSLVMNDPTRDPVSGIGEWLSDGVHQRNPHGRAKWIDLIDSAIVRVNN